MIKFEAKSSCVSVVWYHPESSSHISKFCGVASDDNLTCWVISVVILQLVRFRPLVDLGPGVVEAGTPEADNHANVEVEHVRNLQRWALFCSVSVFDQLHLVRETIVDPKGQASDAQVGRHEALHAENKNERVVEADVATHENAGKSPQDLTVLANHRCRVASLEYATESVDDKYRV